MNYFTFYKYLGMNTSNSKLSSLGKCHIVSVS